MPGRSIFSRVSMLSTTSVPMSRIEFDGAIVVSRRAAAGRRTRRRRRRRRRSRKASGSTSLPTSDADVVADRERRVVRDLDREGGQLDDDRLGCRLDGGPRVGRIGNGGAGAGGAGGMQLQRVTVEAGEQVAELDLAVGIRGESLVDQLESDLAVRLGWSCPWRRVDPPTRTLAMIGDEERRDERTPRRSIRRRLGAMTACSSHCPFEDQQLAGLWLEPDDSYSARAGGCRRRCSPSPADTSRAASSAARRRAAGERIRRRRALGSTASRCT